MNYTLSTGPLVDTKADCLVLAVPEKSPLPASTQQVDALLGGLISQLRDSGDITGKLESTLLIPLSGQPWQRLLLVGSGEDEKRKGSEYRKLVAAAINRLKDSPANNALLALTDTPASLNGTQADAYWKVEMLGRTLEEQLYRFSAYKSEQPPAFKLESIQVQADDTSTDKALQRGLATGRGMNLTRDLGNMPPNICNPVWLAEQAIEMGNRYPHIQTEILDEDQMRALGMNTLLSVSAGSAQPARLIIMQYQGGKPGDKPHVLVGKGITFDTGGISLKPGEGMDEMKYDMGGAASVFGAMQTIAELQPALNIVAVIAAAENMPSGTATRPGDIVTSMSGQTVEILNTDAEGRLVLCDALTYVKRFEPATVVDLATLTGACIIALGHQATGLFSNDDDLANRLLASGEKTCDRAWRLPIWDEYQQQLDSNFADMQNIGGRPAGSITAACFLSRFTKDYRWAHLDIAGTAWTSGKSKGATGRPVPLLIDYLLSYGN